MRASPGSLVAMRVATLCICAVTLSCQVNVDYSSTAFRCADGIPCPPGFQCHAEICVFVGTDANPLVDASDVDAARFDARADAFAIDSSTIDGYTPDAPTPDASSPATCGGASALAEDFEDSLLPYLEATSTGTATIDVSLGHGVITLPPSASGSGRFASKWRFTLRDDRLYFEVIQPPNPCPQTFARFRVGADSDNAAVFTLRDDSLDFACLSGGAVQTQSSTSFHPSQHGWWQFREAAGTVYFETSPDGAIWTPRLQCPSPPWLDAAELVIEAGTDGTDDAPGELWIDNLNGGAVSTGFWCPLSSFSDDFEDNDTSPDWRLSAQSCSVAELFGAIFLQIDAAGGACEYAHRTLFDLTGSSAHIEVVSLPSSVSDAVTYLRLTSATGNALVFRHLQGFLHWDICVANDCSTHETPYDEDEHRWWRIREAEGYVYWEMSKDGDDWSFLLAQPVPFDVHAVAPAFGVYSNNTQPLDVAQFDNYNVY